LHKKRGDYVGTMRGALPNMRRFRIDLCPHCSKIISGIDPGTGRPKGLGVRSSPLDMPTWSGPAVSITVWGIDEYLTTKDDTGETIVYEPDECYYRRCSPDDANGWILTFHTFLKRPPLPIRYRNNVPFLHVAAESGPFSPLHFIVEYRLIDIPGPVVLGLNLNRVVAQVEPKSGWMLGGPSEPGGEGSTMRYCLVAVYPRLMGQTASEGHLDRNEAAVSE
jgi:hypothetical protein